MMDEALTPDLFGHSPQSGHGDLAKFPDVAGFKGEAETGREAAAAMSPHLGRLQKLVFDMVLAQREAGLTPEEAVQLSRIERVSIQPRFSELKAKGKIVDSGQRRLNPSSHKRAVVWVAAEYMLAAKVAV